MTCAGSELFLDLATELMSRGRRTRFRAEGDSVHPTIGGGEAILVEPVSPPDLENGDIAFHHSRRGVTAHRVVLTESRDEQAPVFRELIMKALLTQSPALTTRYPKIGGDLMKASPIRNRPVNTHGNSMKKLTALSPLTLLVTLLALGGA